ncbi:MAG: S8 family serine peptidase [Aestuariibacter sp.]
MLSQFSHNISKIPKSLRKKTLCLLAGSLFSFVVPATADIDKSIERALQKSVQAETERSIEDVVKFAVRSQMRRAVERDVEAFVTDEAHKLVEKVAGKQISNELQQHLLRAAKNTAELEQARLAGLKKTPLKATPSVPIDWDKKDQIVAKPGDNTGQKPSVPEKASQTPDDAEADDAEVQEPSQDAILLSTTERLESELGIAENVTADLHGREIWTKEWVIMTDLQTKSELLQQGYVFRNETYLETFDQILASVQAPASFDLQQDYEAIMAHADNGNMLVDFNHIYRNAEYSEDPVSSDAAKTPVQLMTASDKNLVIGMVDTAYNPNHTLLTKSKLKQSHFLPENARATDGHGTGIASIMVGSHEEYSGIAPNAQVLNASVFFEVGKKQPIATATDILKGLNWLVQNGATVINMSLAGPANRLLEFGINSLCKKGVYVIAAAGNAGPLSEPLYPAGYKCAVAVTAVDEQRQLYRYAVQGDHIDVSAYGVDVLTADSQNRITAASGTSIAAPFISVIIADSLMTEKQPFDLQMLLRNSIDLGESGFDPQYGHGLLLLPTSDSGTFASL